MRILQFNSYADLVGGAEVYMHSLTRELRQRDHHVGLFGTSPDSDVDQETTRIVRRPRYDSSRMARDPTVRQALERFLERLQPELIHVHNVFSIGLDVLSLLETCDIPVVQTVHDFGLLCPNAWCVHADGRPCPGGAGAKCFEHGCEANYPYDPLVVLHTFLRHRAVSRFVDLMICPSRYLADRMAVHGARHVLHLPHFIDPIPDGGASPERRSDHELLYVGRLEPEKGVETLLAAMPAVLSSEPRAHLTIVGGGSLETELRRRCRTLGLREAVTFLRQVPRQDLGRFYATATACVLPSIWTENSPLVAYECIHAGLPMVASRLGGIPELVEEGNAGFTFRPRDDQDLAAQILRLLRLSPDVRSSMSKTMRERARSFEAHGHLDRMQDLYHQARAHHSSRPRPPDDGDLQAILDRLGVEFQHWRTRATDPIWLVIARRSARFLRLPKLIRD